MGEDSPRSTQASCPSRDLQASEPLKVKWMTAHTENEWPLDLGMAPAQGLTDLQGPLHLRL